MSVNIFEDRQWHLWVAFHT